MGSGDRAWPSPDWTRVREDCEIPMTDSIWTAATVLLTVWLMAAAISALVDGPQPRTVRLARDGSAVLLTVLGTVGYMLILDTRPELLPAGIVCVVGIGLGFLAAWRNGALPDNGVAITWTSPWLMALFAASAAITSVGSLGAWEDVTMVGLYGLILAVGFGAGALGFGLIATIDAQRALVEDLNPTTTCPACGVDVPARDRHCAGCGAALPTTCTTCGTTMSANGASCAVCGSERAAALPDAASDAVTVRFCVACLDRVAMEADFCANCGVPLSAACGLCGAPTMADHIRCPLCDVNLDLADAIAINGLAEALVAEIEAELGAEEVADVDGLPG